MPRNRTVLVAVPVLLALVVAPAAAPPLPTPGPPLAAYLLRSTPPTVDGQVGDGEWPFAAQIVIDGTYPESYVRPTYATFVNDSTTLYVLVDAPGDSTDDSSCDECMMIFAPAGGGAVEISIYLVLNQAAQVKPAGVVAAIGFGPSPNSATDHRIYEFAIPLSVIGAVAGEPLSFCSPAFFKTCGFGPGFFGSMPFDGSTGHDNIWPPGGGFSYGDRGTWSLFDFQTGDPVPALGAVGLAVLSLLLAAAAVLALGRRAG